MLGFLVLSGQTCSAGEKTTNSSCEPTSVTELTKYFQTAVQSENPQALACLFSQGYISIEFDRTVWKGALPAVRPTLEQLFHTDLKKVLDGLTSDEIEVDQDKGIMILGKRLRIGYGSPTRAIGFSDESGDFHMYEVRDLVRPNDFYYSGIRSEPEFEDWFSRFQHAAASADSKALSKMTCYPLNVDSMQGQSVRGAIRNTQEFEEFFPKIFSEKIKSIVVSAKWPDLWHNSKGVMLGQGDIWITATPSGECISSISSS